MFLALLETVRALALVENVSLKLATLGLVARHCDVVLGRLFLPNALRHGAATHSALNTQHWRKHNRCKALISTVTNKLESFFRTFETIFQFVSIAVSTTPVWRS